MTDADLVRKLDLIAIILDGGTHKSYRRTMDSMLCPLVDWAVPRAHTEDWDWVQDMWRSYHRVREWACKQQRHERNWFRRFVPIRN